jgi:hypothetical protein
MPHLEVLDSEAIQGVEAGGVRDGELGYGLQAHLAHWPPSDKISTDARNVILYSHLIF